MSVTLSKPLYWQVRYHEQDFSVCPLNNSFVYHSRLYLLSLQATSYSGLLQAYTHDKVILKVSEDRLTPLKTAKYLSNLSVLFLNWQKTLNLISNY